MLALAGNNNFDAKSMAVWWHSSRYGIIGRTLQIHRSIETSTAVFQADLLKLTIYHRHICTNYNYLHARYFDISIQDISYSLTLAAPFMVSWSTSLLAKSYLSTRPYSKVPRDWQKLDLHCGVNIYQRILLTNSNVAGGIHSSFNWILALLCVSLDDILS